MKVPSVFKIPRWFDRALMNVHAGAAHNHRVKLLADLIWTRMAAAYPGKADISCLDICCGEMAVIATIAKQHSKLSWSGVDVHPLPNYMRSTSLWNRYERFNGMQIGHKAHSFDVGLLTDVLNKLPADRQIDLLKESARVCKVVIVKDQLEYGWISRIALMAVDFLSSYGLRVRVPRRYFNHARFVALAQRRVEALVLSSPALDPGLSAIQKVLLAVLPKIAPNVRVGNGLDLSLLSHDPAVVAAYRADNRVHDRIGGRLARFIADTGPATVALAGRWTVPTLLLYAGADQLVNPAGSRAFAAAAPPSVLRARCFDTLYHEIFNELEAEPVFAELKSWLDARF